MLSSAGGITDAQLIEYFSKVPDRYRDRGSGVVGFVLRTSNLTAEIDFERNYSGVFFVGGSVNGVRISPGPS